MPEYADATKKLKAVQELMSSSTTTIQKLKSVHTMLVGINPQLDAKLSEYGKHLSLLESVEKGDVVQLSAQSLPEETEEQKEKKRVLLLFIKTWNQLKEEVARVKTEIEAGNAGEASTWGKIFRSTKGPLAVITIVAVAIALASQATAKITIHNDGCDTFEIGDSVPVSIPRLILSDDSIPENGSAVVTIPPLTVTVDGETPGVLSVSTTGFNKSFSLSSDVRDIIFNGSSLVGAKTEIRLSKQKVNELTVTCGA